MILLILPVIFNSKPSRIRYTQRMGVGGFPLFIAVFALFCTVWVISSCKGSLDKPATPEKAKADFSSAVAESDSLFSHLYTVQQRFHQLKARMAEAPKSVRQTPEFTDLQRRVDGTIIKSGHFYDQVDATKAAAMAELKKLTDSGGRVAAVDSQMTVIRNLVARNDSNLEVFRKVAGQYESDYEKILAGKK